MFVCFVGFGLRGYSQLSADGDASLLCWEKGPRKIHCYVFIPEVKKNKNQTHPDSELKSINQLNNLFVQ